MANLLNDIPSLQRHPARLDSVTLVNDSVQRPNLQQLVATTAVSAEPRLSLVSANLQQAIGVASQSVGGGKATPAQAAATLQKTMQSQQ